MSEFHHRSKHGRDWDDINPLVKRKQKEHQDEPEKKHDPIHQWDHIQLIRILKESRFNEKVLLDYVKEQKMLQPSCDLAGWYIEANDLVGKGEYGRVLEVCLAQERSSVDDEKEKKKEKAKGCGFVVKIMRQPLTIRELAIARIMGEVGIGPRVYDARYCTDRLRDIFQAMRPAPPLGFINWITRSNVTELSYLIMDRAGTETLLDFAERVVDAHPEWVMLAKAQVNAQVEKVFDLHILLNDLHLGNIMVEFDAKTEKLRTWFVDFGTSWILASRPDGRPISQQGVWYYRSQLDEILKLAQEKAENKEGVASGSQLLETRAPTAPKHGRSSDKDEKNETASHEPIAKRTRLREREIKQRVQDIQHKWDHVDLTRVLRESGNKLGAVTDFLVAEKLVRMDCDPKNWKIQTKREVGAGGGIPILEVCLDSDAADEQACDFVVKIIPYYPAQYPNCRMNDALREVAITRIMGEQKLGPRVYDAFVCSNGQIPKTISDIFFGMNRLNHDRGEYEGYLCLIMQKLPGKTVKSYMIEQWSKGKRQQVNRVITLIHARLEQMHKLGMVHNDFHLGNILIDTETTESKDEPRIWIIDFGETRLFNAKIGDDWSKDWKKLKTWVEAYLYPLTDEKDQQQFLEWIDRLPVSDVQNLSLFARKEMETKAPTTQKYTHPRDVSTNVVDQTTIGEQIPGLCPRTTRQTDSKEAPWSTFVTHWTIGSTEARLNVYLSGNSALAEASRAYCWKPFKHESERKHAILDVWFTRPKAGSPDAQDGEWELFWFFSRVKPDLQFQRDFRLYASDAEKQAFQKIGHVHLCFLLQQMLASGHLNLDDRITVHVMPMADGKGTNEALLKYYHCIGFRKLAHPKGYSSPGWSVWVARPRSLLEHTRF